MNRIEEMYASVQMLEDLNIIISEDQRREIKLAEKEYLQEEIIPKLNDEVRRLTKGLRKPFKLVIEFNGNDDCIVREEVNEKYDENRLVLTHPLDWSPFQYGFTIDRKFHQTVFDALGEEIPRGKSVPIIIKFMDEEYKASIGNANIKGRNDTVIRILYNGKVGLGAKLKEIFPKTFEYIKKEKESHNGRYQVKLPDNLKATIKLYSTDEVYNFEMECEK